jgi:phosphoribosylpyrophosphate synthetase
MGTHNLVATFCGEKSRIDESLSIDTVLRPSIDGVGFATLSVVGSLGEAMKRIHSNSSVTSLFEF